MCVGMCNACGLFGRDGLVLARDLEQLVLAPRHVVGVHEVVHRAGMIGVALVDAQQDLGGAIGVFPRDDVRGRGRQQRERIERGGIGVVRERRVQLARSPPPNGGSAASSRTTRARGRTPRRSPRTDARGPSAAPAPSLSARPPSRAAAPPAMDASATAAETASSRCPSAPLRICGSMVATRSNASRACGYVMWCSSATARLNSVCAAAEHETGKSTLPSGWSACGGVSLPAMDGPDSARAKVRPRNAKTRRALPGVDLARTQLTGAPGACARVALAPGSRALRRSIRARAPHFDADADRSAR